MNLVVSCLVAVALIGVDQLTKYWAITVLQPMENIPLISGVFELRYCENTGVAFSMLENQRWIFIPVSILGMALVLLILLRSPLNRHWLFRGSLLLIFAGGIGNLIDRTFRSFVIDFLYFRLIDFPIFNFADCCVCVGAALLFIYILFCYKEKDSLPLKTLLFGIGNKKEPDDGEH